MEGDQLAVGGEPDVGLEAADAQGVGATEGGEGVLRSQPGTAAVGDRQRAALVAVRDHVLTVPGRLPPNGPVREAFNRRSCAAACPSTAVRP
jgi:hypothetical protein